MKVRVGASWLGFADYMIQVKARLTREAEEEKKEEATVGASLEQPGEAGAQAEAAAPGKTKKKKKKKAKKASAAELDLDMDNDSAFEQTRFAGVVKAQEEGSE